MHRFHKPNKPSKVSDQLKQNTAHETISQINFKNMSLSELNEVEKVVLNKFQDQSQCKLSKKTLSLNYLNFSNSNFRQIKKHL